MVFTMPEQKQASTELPGFSLPKIFATISKRGAWKAMDDEEMGPHVHLFYLLIMVFVIAVIIGIVVFLI